MTGYGRSQEKNEDVTITVEMKSVNHRFSEVAVRIPRQFMLYEDKIKKIVNQYINRGKVDVFVNIAGEGATKRSLDVDWDLFDQYVAVLRQSISKYSLEGNPHIDQVPNLPEIFQVTEREGKADELEALLLKAANQAAIQLYQMRQAEGQSIFDDITHKLELITEHIRNISTYTDEVTKSYRDKLLKKVNEFISTSSLEIDETRIMAEVAIMADKSDINEELSRLDSHIGQFYKILKSEDAVGRKLDFLTQEMNREMNTIGSKANHVQINQAVVELKSELEKIKEQVQNVE